MQTCHMTNIQCHLLLHGPTDLSAQISLLESIANKSSVLHLKLILSLSRNSPRCNWAATAIYHSQPEACRIVVAKTQMTWLYLVVDQSMPQVQNTMLTSEWIPLLGDRDDCGLDRIRRYVVIIDSRRGECPTTSAYIWPQGGPFHDASFPNKLVMKRPMINYIRSRNLRL